MFAKKNVVAQVGGDIIIKVRVIDSRTDEPISGAGIELYSRDFIELKGRTASDGIYSSANNPSSKDLMIGANLLIRCSKQGYKQEELNAVVGGTKANRTYRVSLVEAKEEKVYFRGIILDNDTEQIIEGLKIRVRLKNNDHLDIFHSEFGFNREISRDNLINPEQLEVILFKKGYNPESKTIPIPASGDIPPQKLYMRLTGTNVVPSSEKINRLGYIPYIGHFTRQKNEHYKGYLASGLFLASGVAVGYYNNKASSLRGEARMTFNQTSKSEILEDAEKYEDLRNFSIVSMGVTALASLVINLVDQKKYKERKLTNHFHLKAYSQSDYAAIGCFIYLSK